MKQSLEVTSSEPCPCGFEVPIWWGEERQETVPLCGKSLKNQRSNAPARITRLRFLLRLLALYATPKGSLSGMSEALGYNPDYFANVVKTGYLPEVARAQLKAIAGGRISLSAVLLTIESDGI